MVSFWTNLGNWEAVCCFLLVFLILQIQSVISGIGVALQGTSSLYSPAPHTHTLLFTVYMKLLDEVICSIA